MKKKSIFILLLVGLVGLFVPRSVFAADLNFQYMPFVDYRFFVEDEDENDIGNLKFKLHDVNNTISYESEYDPNTNAYYFIDVPQNIGQEDNFKNIDANIFPEYLKEELENVSFNDLNNYQNEWSSIISNISQKYGGLDLGIGLGIVLSPMYSLEFYIPMILEEVNHIGDGEPIKKVVFVIGSIGMPSFDDRGNVNGFYSSFTLMNNTCMYKNSNYMDGASEEYIAFILNKLSLTRNQTFDYSDEIINKYSSGNIASNEIKGNGYLNKGFLSDKFASSEVASGEGGLRSSYGVTSPFSFSGTNMSDKSTDAKVVRLRNSSDNLKEEVLKDYCDCLPVFVQAKKKNAVANIVNTITNPKTWNSGFIVLGISLIVIISTTLLIIPKKKKNN